MANERLLVLEDHGELREQTRHILTDAGYRVQVAATHAEAIDLARREPFDLLVADILLPDGSGIDTFQQMRALCPGLAGIVITGYSTWETAMNALRVGFCGFIVKPFVPEQLIATVVSALEQESLRRENARLSALVPLYELSRAFVGTVELDELLQQIIAIVQQETSADSVSLLLFDDDHRALRISAAVGLPAGIADIVDLQNTVAGRVAARGEPVIIAENVPLDPEIRKAMRERSDISSAMSLPLIARGQVIGVLNASRHCGGQSFSHGHLGLATVLASQAAISIDNARLFQQLKRLSEISQTLASAMDLDEAIATIVAAPQRLVRAHGAVLWLLEDETLRLVKAEGLEGIPVPPLAHASVRAQFSADNGGGWATLPLQHSEKTIGALMVRFNTNQPRDERLGVLKTFALAAGAVLESHRLRAREANAFRELDRAVRADLSIRQMLEHMLDQMLRACQAEGGAVFLWDAEHDRLEPWITTGMEARADWARTIIREGRAGIVTDQRDTNAAAMGAPMRVGSRVEGAIILARSMRLGSFHARQLDLLSTLTSSAALIVRNTQLYARSEEAAIAEERTRIAREIHDGLAQDLSFLVLKASTAQKLLGRGEEKELQRELREITDQLRQDAREVRRVIFALRPLDIESLGFMPALEKFVKEFASANDIQVHFDVTGDMERLPAKVETALFRLTQEALNNVRKHARAKNAWVRLERIGEQMVTLCIQDDGRGFDVIQQLQAARTRGSVGLLQMRERTERAGGIFRVESTPGIGTKIQAELPLREL